MLYKQNLLLGALFILLSELMFASMGATVKFVTQTLPSDMAVFMRNLFGLALLMPLVWSNGWVSFTHRDLSSAHVAFGSRCFGDVLFFLCPGQSATG